ncbi:MAG TPA: serine/threonine-protein kinase [Polyangiaceae bacterium]|nr:serine/threonine-protein kinase [Polyangiaceae bacterium]
MTAPRAPRRLESSGGFVDRGRFHVTSAVVGAGAGACWNLALALDDGDLARAPNERWASVALLLAFALLALLGSRLSRARAGGRRLDVACTALSGAAFTASAARLGPYAMSFSAVPALLVLAQSVTGGRTSGFVAWASTVVTLLLLDRLGAGHASRDHATVLLSMATSSTMAYGLGLSIRRAVPTRSVRSRRNPLASNGYEVERLLGGGSTSRVYAAWTKKGARVVVKVLRGRLTRRAGMLDRMRRDVETAARLPPSRTARILDFDLEGPPPHYVVTERLDGEDLATRLRRLERLSLDETVELTTQLAAVLDAAADAGLIHGEVKPKKVFLVDGERLDARLLDFGLRRVRSEEETAESAAPLTLVGSAGYLAPELVAPSYGEPGAHTDVFALGCLVFRVLSGVPPFPARDAAGAAYEAMHLHPPSIRTLRPELPEGIDWVLALALAKATAQRYGRAGEFARDLDAVVHGRPPPELAPRALALLRSRPPADQTLTS